MVISSSRHSLQPAIFQFLSFANNCTLHGANHIFIGNGFGVRQSLWAGAFLISLSIFLSQAVGRIFYYLEYHHITQLDEQESPQLTFPAVTFCNINRIRGSQLTYNYLSYISPLLGYDVGTYLEAGFPLATPSFDVPEEPLNLLNFYDRSSHQLEDMMLACRYRGEICRPEDFTMVSDDCLISAVLVMGRKLNFAESLAASWLVEYFLSED
uniref:Acid-sensing ion channel 1 n=1 Tax=Laticauda laticaudata TaxID=8630 RepID=A0A8C5S7Q1_LATLA